MIRKKKLYSRPRKLYQKGRIAEENVLLKKYGLKNKREVWKSLAKVKYFRARAMKLARQSPEEQSVFFGKLNALGLKVSSIADVLDLKLENILERRLPTIVMRKGFAPTAQAARQLVTHRRIFVGGNVVDAPSFIVPLALENEIVIKPASTKVAKVETKAEAQVKMAPVKAEVKEIKADEGASDFAKESKSTKMSGVAREKK
jgi:small subunit ribosomal protein S4